jgi:exosortase/archaeosortase
MTLPGSKTGRLIYAIFAFIPIIYQENMIKAIYIIVFVIFYRFGAKDGFYPADKPV